MALPTRPKQDPRNVSVTVRLSKKAADQLKALAKSHNISQADVVEHLIQQEAKIEEKKL